MDILLEKASHTMPGEAYNRYREEVEKGSGPKAVFYEVSLMEERPWAYLCDRVYPPFARYLRDKKLDPESGEGVVVVLFHGIQCYLLKGPDFLRVFRDIEGLDSASFRSRLREWLSN